MAQTGYTPILLYSSSTVSAVPAVGSLTNSTLGSELAINITDGKLFYKDNTNNVQVIGWKVVPTTAGGTGLTSYAAGDLIYYASGSAFTKLPIGGSNTVLTSSGSAPQWSTSINLISLGLSGNLTFTSVGTRIFGDFSNATISNRVLFQTTTLNGNTSVGAIPLGVGNRGEFAAYSGSNPNIAIGTQLVAISTESSLRSIATGGAGYAPLTIHTGGSEQIRINTAGDVGMGITSPASKLDVNGVGTFRASASAQTINMYGRSLDNASTLQLLTYTGGSLTGYLSHTGTRMSLTNVINNQLTLGTNNIDRVWVLGSGYVGINASSPGGQLEVNGDNTTVGASNSLVQFRTVTSQAADVGAALQLGGVYQNPKFLTGFAEIAGRKENSTNGDDSGYLQFSTRQYGVSFAERMRITSAGDVGINTTSPKAAFETNGISNSPSLTAAAGIAALTTNSTVRLIFGGYTASPYGFWLQTKDNQGGGNGSGASYPLLLNPIGGLVGIGTTNPGEELHVVGQGYFTAGCYIGSNSTTDNLIDDASNGSGSATLYIGNASITTSSDRRLKRDVRDTEIDALAKVNALRVVDFTWDDPSDTSWNNKNARGRWTGLIAQEAIEQVPWAVNAPRNPETLEPLPDAKDEAGNDRFWFMEYQQMVPMLVRGMQQQQAQIETLKAQMAAIKGG